MKKFLYVLLIFIFVGTGIFPLCATASLWDNLENPTETSTTSTTEMPTSLDNLIIVLLKASDFADFSIPSDVFQLSGDVAYPNPSNFIKVKAVDVTTSPPKDMVHNPDMGDTTNTAAFCENTDQTSAESKKKYCDEATKKIEAFCSSFKGYSYCGADGKVDYTKVTKQKLGVGDCNKPDKKYCSKGIGNNYLFWCKDIPYDGTQGFSCSLSVGANTGLTLDSKIKLRFLDSSDKFLAETSPIELKAAQDGKAVLEHLVITAVDAMVNLLSDGKSKPSEKPLDSSDTDGDKIVDIKDNFPSIPNQDQKTPVTITTDSDDDGVRNDIDNCPDAANPNQEDSDTDGIGDVCDPDMSVSTADSSHGGGDCSLNPAATTGGMGWLVDLFILGLPTALIGIRRRK